MGDSITWAMRYICRDGRFESYLPLLIIMTEREIYNLYVLQSKNVRRLKQVQKNLIKDINFYIKKNDDFQVEIKTKLLTLLYCTISEAQFIQILHTPKGLSFSEIEEVKRQRSLTAQWLKMIDLAMSKVGDWRNNQDLLNRREYIKGVIIKYIHEPREIRNRIGHGQWIHALTSNLENEHTDLTQKISNLDVVKITIWLKVHEFLAKIIRDLVQSPRSAYHRDYWTNTVELEKFLIESEDWSLEKRKRRINRKKK